ncbi:DUF748 domain-containing protein [Ferrimonas sp. YFM]|uniref:DUF748 domain-containing protein n=1 Tax=Ferrimonas sp. YFM TaxID=3028878 RepID=UPI002573F6FF|nr:DUF748 domain-containing protein [Ferrimonas sp. YFM]BDY06484.1 hypothetical protein F0521_35250 [Ferrimonas sp. YFM]
MNIKTLWSNPWIRRGGWGLLVLLIYLLLTGWGLPRLIQSQAPKWVADNLNGQLTLEKVAFHPFAWRLQIDGVRLDGDDGEPVLGLQQLILDLDPLHSLFTLSGRIKTLSLQGPELAVRELGQGRSNLGVLLKPLTESSPSPEAEPQEPTVPQLYIADLNLESGVVSYRRPDGASTRFTDLELDAQNLALAGADNKMALALSGSGGGRLLVEATASLAPADIQMELTLDDLDLTRYWPFIKDLFRFQLDQGRLDLHTGLRFQRVGNDSSLTLNDGTIELSGLNLSSDQGPLLTLAKTRVAGISLDLNERSVSVAKLALEQGQILGVNSEQGLDWATLFQPVIAEDTDAQPDPASNGDEPEEPWRVTLAGTSVEQFRLTLEDRLPREATTWILDLDRVTVGPASNDLSQPIALEVLSRINDDAAFSAKGELVPQTLNAQFELNLERFPLTATIPYWQDLVPLKMTSGSLSCVGTLTLAGVEPLDLSYDGQLAVQELVTQDPAQGRDFVKWQQLDVNSLKVGTAPLSVALDTVAVTQPYARVIIDEDGSTNIQQLLGAESQPQGADAAAEAEDGGASEPLQLSINRIELSDGGAFFADNSLTPKFATGIETLAGSISGLSSKPDSRAKVDIQGQVDRYAPVSLTGELQPLAAESYLDMALTFDNVDLTSLNAYSGTYAGYFIDQGQLDLYLNYKLDKRKMVGSNRAVVDKLKLGKRSDSDKATSLPVALAVALLQDSNGVIDLGLEVQGDVDDPEFAIGPLVGKALFNAITKVVTSPFTLLGSLLGGEEPASEVLFEPGVASVSPGAQAQLKRLADGLSQRPGLSLSVQGAVSVGADRSALASKALSAELGFDATPEQGLTPEQQTLLVSAYERRFGVGSAPPPPEGQPPQAWQQGLYNQLLERVNLPLDALPELAASRAQAVKQVLIAQFGIGAERVFIQESRVELNQSGPKVVMSLEAL